MEENVLLRAWSLEMLEFFVKQRSFQNRGSSVLLYQKGKVVS